MSKHQYSGPDELVFLAVSRRQPPVLKWNPRASSFPYLDTKWSHIYGCHACVWWVRLHVVDCTNCGLFVEREPLFVWPICLLAGWLYILFVVLPCSCSCGDIVALHSDTFCSNWMPSRLLVIVFSSVVWLWALANTCIWHGTREQKTQTL